MSAVAARAMSMYDRDGDGLLELDELQLAVGASDGKISLASLDPGMDDGLSNEGSPPSDTPMGRLAITPHGTPSLTPHAR